MVTYGIGYSSVSSSFGSFSNRMNGDSYDIDYEAATQSQQIQYSSTLTEENLVAYLTEESTGKVLGLSRLQPEKIWKIGRSIDNWLCLPEVFISQVHCELIWNGKSGKDSEVLIRDKSKNGTVVNQRILKREEVSILKPGATIRLGSSEIPNQKQYVYIYRNAEGIVPMNNATFHARYDLGAELGQGAFARVFRCIERSSGHPYAVKKISKEKLMRTGDKSVDREIKILRSLNHPHIVGLKEHFEDAEFIYLILELVDGPDLLGYVLSHVADGMYMAEFEVQRMAAQICQAIAYIHGQGITHRDLKPENIILTNTVPPICKVADFGLSKIVDDATFLRTACGTPAYLAPEVMLRIDIQRDPYTDKVDSFSLGVILFCMLTNSNPFPTGDFDYRWNEEERKKWFENRQVQWYILMERAGNLSGDAIDFVKKLLEIDPRKRLEVSRALDHPWIRELIPSQSRVFYGDSQSSSEPSQKSKKLGADGAFECSQSMEQLQLSDQPIPGLSMHPGSSAPSLHQVPMEEMSEVSVTSKIPGAYPKSQSVKLAPVHEESAGASWDFVPQSTTGKRKSEYITGNSSLSSLSSLSSDEGEPMPGPKSPSPSTRILRPRAASAPPKNVKGTRKASSVARLRSAEQEEPALPASKRKTRGQPVAKAARRR